MFAWKINWIWENESFWGIINKLKYANYADDCDILNIISNSNYPTVDDKKFILSNCKFDYNKLSSILGLDIASKLEKEVANVLLPFHNESFCMSKSYSNKTSGKWFRSELHYCPECIKLGYHSLYHQYSFNDKCFIHKMQLQSCCPKCGANIPFSINKNKNNKAFSCKCGYKLFNEPIHSAYDIWETKMHKVTHMERREGIFSILIPSCHTTKETILNSSTADMIMDLCTNDLIKQPTYKFCVLTNKKVSSCFTLKDSRSDPFNLDEIYWSAVKTAERHIRKSMNIKKIKKIHHLYQIDHSIDYFGVQTTAYFAWIRCIEGLTDLQYIHNKSTANLRNHPRSNDWGVKTVFNELITLDALELKYEKEHKMFIFHNVIYRIMVERLLNSYMIHLNLIIKEFFSIKDMTLQNYFDQYKQSAIDTTQYILEINEDWGRLWSIKDEEDLTDSGDLLINEPL